jgi:hypothetical protein
VLLTLQEKCNRESPGMYDRVKSIVSEMDGLNLNHAQKS